MKTNKLITLALAVLISVSTLAAQVADRDIYLPTTMSAEG
jgi:hypothetical protein